MFKILILCIPVNLGKHFIYPWSYYRGILVDYLIPTINFLDIVLFLVIAFWLLDVGFRGLKQASAKNSNATRVLLLFLLSLTLSAITSINIYASLHYIARIFLYVLLVFYVFGNFNKTFWLNTIIMYFAVSVALVSLTGILQWQNQGSIFDNYMYFGEQPYSASTRGVAIENILGANYIPSYGTFRHPNIFGGFLALSLLWLFVYIPYDSRILLALILGMFALFFTFSQIAWLAFVLGLVFLLIKNLDRTTILPGFLTGLIVILGLFLPFFSNEWSNTKPSFYRRANLIQSSYAIISERFWFGTGPNTNTLVIEQYAPPSQELRFVQPVHNMFLLVLAENGIFNLISFVMLFILCIKRRASLLMFISILQILILGSFDHYFVTINQLQLLFWLTLGLTLTYNSFDYV